MRRAWHDGTRAILFEPHELIERLAALVPKPRINLLLYHGVLGPSARLRSFAVTCARALPPPRATPEISPPEDQAPPQGPLVAIGPAPPPPRGTKNAEAARGSANVGPTGPGGQSLGPGSSRSEPRPYTSWADLLRRTFEIDILACPECGGRLRFLATIEDLAVGRRILSHLGIPRACPQPLPARSPPREMGLFDRPGD